jgi:predicted CoA-binding protein
MTPDIKQFLDGSPFAVVGASTDRNKYGNKVLRCYLQHDLPVIPVNPSAKSVEGIPAFPDLHSIDQPVHAISIITPPAVTRQMVQEAGSLGIRYVWMQPGAEDDEAIQSARRLGMTVIAGGPCLLVTLGCSGD